MRSGLRRAARRTLDRFERATVPEGFMVPGGIRAENGFEFLPCGGEDRATAAQRDFP